jgi:N-acetylneuraminic acid mutarotase
MNKLTQVILLVSALLWLPADGLMTSATAQTTPVPTDATTNPATIRLQKRMEALQLRNERFAASRPTARDADPVASPLDDLQGKWEPRAPLPTGPRERALNFTIGDKFYVAVGRSLPGWAVRGLNATDVWAYDFATDAWEEISPFPGPGMRNCASFVIDGIAYAVTGHSSTTYIDVFWKYDPTTDTWEELPPFPGGRRS